MVVKFYYCYCVIAQGFDRQNPAMQIGEILTDELCHLSHLNATNHFTITLALGFDRENIQRAGQI